MVVKVSILFDTMIFVLKNNLRKKFPALNSRDFTIFWFAQFISNIGTQMQLVALNWHVYILTNSAFALGLIGLLRFLPILIFSLIGGSVADAYNRKKILFITQSILIIMSIILYITTARNIINVSIIYIVTLFYAAALSFDTPARQAFFPNLVHKKDLTSAISLNSIMIQIARIFGPTIAGILIAQSNLQLIYATNAVSFLTVLFALYFIKTSGIAEGSIVSVSFKTILGGLSFVKSKTIIWSTMLLDFVSTFFSSATVLFPIFARDILKAGPTELGLLYAAPSIGAVIMGVFIAHRPNLRNQGKILLTAVSLYAIGTIIFGTSTVFILSFISLIIVGAGDSVSTIIRNVIRQIETPDNMRGRASAINMVFFMGGPQLGDSEAGFLAGLIGAPFSVVIGGVGTLIAAVIIGFKIPKLRKYDRYDDRTIEANPLKLI